MANQNTYISSSNQSVMDICVELYGSLDYLAKLLTDNSLPISDFLPAGIPILYDSTFTPLPFNISTGITPNGNIPIVTGLTITNPTSSTIEISWNPIFGATNYIYQINTSGIQPTFTAGISTMGSNHVILSGLVANTQYFFYVAAVLNTGGSTDFTQGVFINNYFLITNSYYVPINYVLDGYVYTP